MSGQRVPGTERVVVDMYGKQALLVTFLRPNGQEEKFLLFGWGDGAVIILILRGLNLP